MLNKAKLGLAALAALFSLSAFAEEGDHGFYVTFEEFVSAPTDLSAENTIITVEFCEVRDRHHMAVEGHDKCVSTKLDADAPTFIAFHKDTAFLRKLKVVTTPDTQIESDASRDVLVFDKPFDDCTVDVNVQVNSKQLGKGYTLLAITGGEPDEVELTLNCDNGSVFFPGR